jgi:hypothetical protein
LKKLKELVFMRESENAAPGIINTATHEGTGRKRGPAPKRRYQKGSFQVQKGKAYTLFYRDVEKPDGTITTERTRQLIGDLSVMSERAARLEHDLFMAHINRRRGSVPSPIRGETFQDAVNAWKKDVPPQLSPATVGQRESYLRIHILPAFAKISDARFGRSSLAAIRHQSANQLVSEDHRQCLGDSLCSIALCKEVRDENQ